MSCLLGHNYIVLERGVGGYQQCGIVVAEDIAMVLLVCTKCGKEKIVEG